MLHDIIEIKNLEGYTLFICFDDGICGKVNINEIVPFVGIFAPLRDKKFFDTVTINHELGTIVWENGADLAPETIYEKITQNKS